MWFTNPTTALIAVISADVWQWTPMMFLILLAGLIGVPEDQVKAARLLGASWAQVLLRISLPRIKGVIAIAIGIRLIESIKLFDVMYIMTKGGPGVATQTLSLYIYKRTYGDLEWAYVAAMGLTIVVVMSLAALVAIPLGFLIGMSPLLYRALDPFIQVLKPISPLAWMPLALFTLKDSNVSAVFVIFICSMWPMLVNTAFGIASVRRDWLNVARTLEVSPLRKAFTVILPAGEGA